MTPHVGGIHLAMLGYGGADGRAHEGRSVRQAVPHWISQGSQAMETKLWAGDYYLHILNRRAI